MLKEKLEQFIIDNPEDREFKVNGKVYTDQELYEKEIELFFEKSWVYVCHEDQIKQENDYFLAQIGKEPVIITRSADGQIQGFINRCPHRGATVCREHQGNSKSFRCFYHGWTFRNNGDCIGVADQQAYPSNFDKSKHGLTKVAKVESYRGFVFASLEENVPTLEEHLGNAKPFLDVVIDRYADGIEVANGVTKYGNVGNWKLQLENALDYYHPLFVHKSYFDIVAKRGVKRENASLQFKERVVDHQLYLGGGHGLTVHYRDFLKAGYLEGELFQSDFRTPEWEEKVGPLMAKWTQKISMHLLIFPNLLIMEGPALQIRQIRPVSVDRTEVYGRAYYPKGQPDEYTSRQLAAYEFLGPAGHGTPDDIAAFESCTVGYQSEKAPWNNLSRGYDREVTDASELEISELSNFEVAGNISDDTFLRAMFRHWKEQLAEEKDASKKEVHA
ncbi:Rieske 2Fe-2S domain-containing protein [Niallia oryzisoli]|uniref:aromatic ring-hydroxylating oxygenase subunit alpha n=1 Tax=Niallia oryzisoli TaxID=1737571 RepID=UPI003736366C